MPGMADYAARYAEALLAAAKRENSVREVCEEIGYLGRELARYAVVFDSPVFSVQEQLALLESVLGQKFHPLTVKFMCLLASMRRLGGIEKVAGAFVAIAHSDMGRIDLEIKVFEDATPEILNELVYAAGEKGLYDTGRIADISVSVSQDGSLLGGFSAECGGVVWDCSMRSRLGELSKILRKA